MEKTNTDWAKLDSISTDGCPEITGKRAGCLALLEQFLQVEVEDEVSRHYSPGAVVWKKSETEACHGCGCKMCI